MKKADLIKILVDEYGYEKEDLKFDSEGKPYTNAKLQAIIKAEEEDAKQFEAEATRVVKAKSFVKDEDKIVVMNGLTDVLVYHSERTNRRWEFTEFGQQDQIEFSELVAMRNRYPRFFTEGWLIILDKQVQEEFKLTEMYKNILTPENLDNVFEMRNLEELDKFIDALPEGMKETFVAKAQEKYDADQLDSVALVKHIQKKFNFSFDDNSPLDDVVLSTDTGSHNIIYVDKI